jgi:hypothetical protein
MPLPLAAIGAASSVLSGIAGIFGGGKQKREAKKIKPVYKPYETSQSAKDMMGMAQTQLNARNPLAEIQKRAALGSQANAMAGVQRNSVDASQNLAMAGAIQGQTDQALGQLAMQDEAQAQQRMSNLMNAQNVMIGEDRMKYQDMLQKYQMDMDQKMSLQNAGNQNIVGGLGKIGSTLIAASGSGLFGKGANSATAPKGLTYQGALLEDSLQSHRQQSTVLNNANGPFYTKQKMERPSIFQIKRK